MTNVPAPSPDPGASPEPAAASGTPPSDSDLTPYEDRLFARILLDWQLVRSEQLEAGLHAQAEARARGQHCPLGEYLVGQGSITVGDVFRVLKEQSRRAESVPDVPRYEIRDRIGEGASSVVYRAWDRELRRTVALKVLRDSAGMSEVARERFRREARTTAGLSHLNVVTVHDAGESKGQFYLVMEYVDGKPLGSFLHGPGRMDRNGILVLLEKAARGVGAAHDKGIVHRDLKPDNILVTPEGEPKVADFGLAHVADSTLALTRTGATLGTPLYMSPEQVQGRPADLTPRTDVYGLGAILYEALTDRPPFQGQTLQDIYAKIANEEPQPPRRLLPSLEPELEAIVLKALEKDPRRRYADATTFAEDLRRFREGQAVHAKAAAWPLRAWKRISRYPGTAASGVAGLVVAAVLLGTWAPRRGAESLSSPFLERLEGDAFVLTGEDRKPAVAGSRLDPGQGIETVRSYTRVLLRFPDRSHLELGTSSTLRDVRTPSGGGVRAQLARGTFAAEVQRRPRGGSWSLHTPHGTLETGEGIFKVVVTPGEQGATRVQAQAGSLRLTRHPDGASIDLRAGHGAVISSRGELVAEPIYQGTSRATWTSTTKGGWRLAGDPDSGRFELIGAPESDEWEWINLAASLEYDIVRSPLRVQTRFICPTQDPHSAVKIGFGVRRANDPLLPYELKVEVVDGRITIGYQMTDTKAIIGFVEGLVNAGELLDLEVVLDPAQIDVRVADRSVFRTLHGFDGLRSINPGVSGLSSKAARKYTVKFERLNAVGVAN
jgi:tRNA A-37 threonylcarbamoyl transferase component Bud32